MELNTNEVLDLSKENIQPLRQGKRTTHSGTILQAQDDSDMQRMLIKERDELKYKIRMYEGNDPLEPYYNYVTWLEQNYPKMSLNNIVIPLMEDILIKFKECPEYKQDSRLIQILVKYISAQKNSLEIYQLVYQQGLGTMCSLFYKRWAEELDNVNDFKKADKVFQLGIGCRAQPIKDLEDAYVQFQLSIARRMLEGKITINTQTNDPSIRTVLSTLPSSKIQNNRCSNESTGVLPFQDRIAKDQNKFQEYEEKFEDDIKCEIKNKKLLTKSNLVNQEKKTEVERWYSVERKQSCLLPKPANIPFQIYKDSESTQQSVKSVERERPQPLRRKSEFKCPVAIFEPPDPTKKPMYPKHLVYVDGRDIQLEEIRAADWLNSEQVRAEKSAKEVLDEPINLTKSSNASSELCHAVNQPSPLDQPTWKRRYSDSNLTNQVINTEGSSYDQSWYLKTEFIQPVKLPQTIEPVTRKTPVVNVDRTTYNQSLCLATEFIQPFKLPHITEPVTIRKFPSETHLSTESTLKRKFELVDTVLKTEIAHQDQDKIHQRLEDDIFNFSNHLTKDNASAFHHSPSASFTVNTRAAMNVIQKMWESPLAPRSAKVSKAADDLDLFKMPVTRKSQCFKVQSISENDSLLPFTIPDECKTSRSPLHFSVFTDENAEQLDQVQKPAGIAFPVYCEENETKPEINVYARLSSRSSSRKNTEIGDQLFSSMSSLKINYEQENKSKILSTPLIIPVQLQDTPKRPENKENDPPENFFIASERNLQVLGDIAHTSDDDENKLFDETCSTKAFAVLLPSSTPFSRPDHARRSRKSSIFNGSYIEENAASVTPAESNALSVNACTNPTNLSLILENSKEHGYSSSGGVPKSLS